MSHKTFSNHWFKIRLVDMGRIFLSNGRALWPLSGIQVAEVRLCWSFDRYFVSVCSLELSSSTGLSSSWPERFLLWGGTLNVLRFQAASSVEVQMMEKRMTSVAHPLHLHGENNGKKITTMLKRILSSAETNKHPTDVFSFKIALMEDDIRRPLTLN